MNTAEYILRVLEKEGVTKFFMVPGKLINPLMSCYSKESSHLYNIKPIIAAQEGGAAAMADGYARATGGIGVCVSIDGPGTANAIPMLASAQADGSQVLHIAGRIPQDFECMGAIQDTSQSGIRTVEMLKPVCKKSLDINNATTLPRYLRDTLKTMATPSKGTGYLSIAKEVLLAEASEEPIKAIQSFHHSHYIDDEVVATFVDTDLKASSKIVILIGNRCPSEMFYKNLINISEEYAIPVATTISSKGLFPENHPNFLGIFGYSGHQRAHDVLLSPEVDIVLLLGFDVTQWTTLAWHEEFINQKIVQVDKDPSYLGRFLKIHMGILGDEIAFLKAFIKQGEELLQEGSHARKEWIENLSKTPLHTQELSDLNEALPIHPAHIVQTARKLFPKNTIAVADAGVHRSYATHYWTTYHYNSFFAATSFAPMGWAIPASIGIAVARPKTPIVVFSGDGCMLMSAFEIQTAVKLNLNLTIIVFNNGYYGASYFNNINNEPYLTQIPQHNWAVIAKGLGATGFRVHNPAQLQSSLEKCNSMTGVKLIDVICDHEARAPFPLYAQTLKTRPFM